VPVMILTGKGGLPLTPILPDTNSSQTVLIRLIYHVNGLPTSILARCAQPKTFSLAIDMGCHVYWPIP